MMTISSVEIQICRLNYNDYHNYDAILEWLQNETPIELSESFAVWLSNFESFIQYTYVPTKI